jgi:hypothetical protein
MKQKIPSNYQFSPSLTGPDGFFLSFLSLFVSSPPPVAPPSVAPSPVAAPPVAAPPVAAPPVAPTIKYIY